jgi:hypothetical protein
LPKIFQWALKSGEYGGMNIALNSIRQLYRKLRFFGGGMRYPVKKVSMPVSSI